MATLTVRDAARRLGVKPRKVRLYISERKLSARAAPHASDRHPSDRILLDADEVETLAQIRAQKRRRTPRRQLAANEADQARGAAAARGSVEPVPSAAEEAVPAADRAEWRAAVVVQPLLQPLVLELHDARETIRRQAEELGALRATVAELQRRLHAAEDTVMSRGPIPTLPDAEMPRRSAIAGTRTIPAANGQGAIRRFPLWQRALAHLLHGSLSA